MSFIRDPPRHLDYDSQPAQKDFMPNNQECRYWIVKHGLDAFEMLPHCIWRSDMNAMTLPKHLRQVKTGDRWISYAYTTSDNHEKSLSQVVGFYECTREVEYGERNPLPEGSPVATGWFIDGVQYGENPTAPVGVPSIDALLGRTTFKQTTLLKISATEFEPIRRYALDNQLDPTKIPVFQREPSYEQEVVAIVAHAYKQIGISRLFRVRTAFPDLLAGFDDGPSCAHLELELYSESYLAHGHHLQTLEEKERDLQLAVLCWIHNCKEVENHVDEVFELRSLLRSETKISWRVPPHPLKVRTHA